MKFLLFSNSAETQFRVRRIVKPAEDSLVTIKDEELFFRIIQTCRFDLFLIDLTASCYFSDLRSKMQECMLDTPWILLSMQSNLSVNGYLSYWNALNGIKLCFDGSSALEKKLKILALSLKKNNDPGMSKNARKLLDFFVDYQNKSISIETLQEKVFGEKSDKNRNLLYGLIHEIRKAIGDDFVKPRNLIRCTKGRYKLANIFPEKSLDVCIYGLPVENEYAKIFPVFYTSHGYDVFPSYGNDEYENQPEKIESGGQDIFAPSFSAFYENCKKETDKKRASYAKSIFAEIVEERCMYSYRWLKEVPNSQYLYEAVERLNGKNV